MPWYRNLTLNLNPCLNRTKILWFKIDFLCIEFIRGLNRVILFYIFCFFFFFYIFTFRPQFLTLYMMISYLHFSANKRKGKICNFHYPFITFGCIILSFQPLWKSIHMKRKLLRKKKRKKKEDSILQAAKTPNKCWYLTVDQWWSNAEHLVLYFCFTLSDGEEVDQWNYFGWCST